MMFKEKFAYRLLCITGATVLFAVVLADELKLDVFFKPLVILVLMYIYLARVERVNYLVLLSLAVVTCMEVLVMLDFVDYFRYIVILQSIYYLMNMILLWKTVQRVKVKYKKIFTIQLVISMVLIGYVLYAVTSLILPSIINYLLYVVILIVCFMLFTFFCYYIYVNTRTIVSFSLMIAGSCFLVVNAIQAFNEFYIYLKVFVVISHMLQIFGQFFLIKFFVEEDLLVVDKEEFI